MAERSMKNVMSDTTGQFDAERFVAGMLKRHNATVLPADPNNTEGERHKRNNNHQPQRQLQLF